MTRLAVLGTWCLLACGGGGTDPAFTVVAEGQPSSLLSVWGTTSSDVWVVGGDPRNDTGPIALHYDGTSWTKHDTGLRNVDLWWVYGFAGGPVFMSGSGGKIVKFENGTFTPMTTPGTLIVFGMWGAAPNDLWAVGGNFSGGGFAWHYDGTAWVAQAGLPPALESSGTLFKVGGRASNDVWMVGTTGTAIHWNGSALEPMASHEAPQGRPLDRGRAYRGVARYRISARCRSSGAARATGCSATSRSWRRSRSPR
jgi:hypothetical protein